jgi:hypothetical protein
VRAFLGDGGGRWTGIPRAHRYERQVDEMNDDEPAVNADRLDALVDAVIAVHGGRLDDAQRQLLHEHAERLRVFATRLDSLHLENADEPDFSFQAIDRIDVL